MSSFVITEQWLKQHATEHGGYTHAQWHALGIPLKNNSGWKQRLIGQKISPEIKKAFEDAKYISAKTYRNLIHVHQLMLVNDVYKPAKNKEKNKKKSNSQLKKYVCYDRYRREIEVYASGLNLAIKKARTHFNGVQIVEVVHHA